jgi:hypothetical protein
MSLMAEPIVEPGGVTAGDVENVWHEGQAKSAGFCLRAFPRTGKTMK